MRSVPTTMARTTATGSMPLYSAQGDLPVPEEIVIWEILVRLPPKPLLHCRAVCRSWRRQLTSPSFLLEHHRRQPSLPLVCSFDYDGGDFRGFLDTLSLASRAGAAQLHPVTRLHEACFHLLASCDGLLVFSQYMEDEDMFVCNPATGQFSRLDFGSFMFVGFYPHRPTGEYRLLLYPIVYHGEDVYMQDQAIGPGDAYYVLPLGSQLPRCIGVSTPLPLSYKTHVLLHGSLHWDPLQHQGSTITVFDTKAETFRSMHGPVVPDGAHRRGRASCLFEMEGTLGMYSCSGDDRSVYIWVLQDYRKEAWEFRCRVELPVAEIRQQFGEYQRWDSMVVSQQGDVHVIIHCDRWLLHVDVEGKLLTRFHRDDQVLQVFPHMLKQSLIRHTFFEKLQGYVLNGSPFI